MTFSFGNFFRDVSSLFSPQRVMGIDIGTTRIKMVELSHTRKGYVLENYAIIETTRYLERTNEALQSSSFPFNEERIYAALDLLLRETKPRATHVILGLPLFRVFVTPIEMPALSHEDTTRSLTFQARQYIPLSIQSVILDWTLINQFTNVQGRKMQRVLLTAIPRDLVERSTRLFRALHLTLSGYEPESHALLRVMGNKDDLPTLVVDIGALSTMVMVEEKGVLQYVRQVDYGGFSLTYAFARSLGISSWRAEELKRRKGILGVGGEQELSTSLLPFIDVILQECERAKTLYEQSSGTTVARVVLSGGSVALPGFERYAVERLQMQIVHSRPFEYVQIPSSLQPLTPQLSRECAVALGLAFRYFS